MSSYQQALSSNASTANSNNNNNSSNNSGGNNPDSKKDEFRRYLERTNVVDSLTKVLVCLYEEPDRPSNPIEYVRRYLGGGSSDNVDALKKENDELRAQVERLNKELESHRKQPRGGAIDP